MMNSLEANIRANYEDIQARIAKAAGLIGQPADAVCTVVVSKLQSIDVIRAAYHVGIRSFGENYPQEAEQKISQLTDLQEITWHMIGQIQSRKSATIARNFQMIHSIDSVQHAQKIDTILKAENKSLTALLEINVGGEESKAGWKADTREAWEKLLPEIDILLGLPNLKIRGLMTMPPLAELPELNRSFFSKLRHMAQFLNEQFSTHPFSILSMGTSADFEVAIQEGATMVRIGQAILGPRPARLEK